MAVITGTRAEYGLLYPVMKAIEGQPALRLQLVVTGMHLLRKFGHTVDLVRRDGWTVDARIRMQRDWHAACRESRGFSNKRGRISRWFWATGSKRWPARWRA